MKGNEQAFDADHQHKLTDQTDWSSWSNPPIAYKVIKHWPGGPEVGYEYKVVKSQKGHSVILVPTELQLTSKEFTSLKEFFKPIFRPASIKIPYEGGELEVTIETFGLTRIARTEGYTFTREELKDLIDQQTFIGRDGRGEKGYCWPTTFTFGCSCQYKGITAESIKKVIDLL